MTSGTEANLHATAVVLGTTGFLIVGPSGVGKSSIALSCILSARHHGLFGALVADDQVLISRINDRIVARRPSSISGLIELRGSGILSINSISSAVMDCAILPVKAPVEERIPPEAESYPLPGGHSLPLWRLPFLEYLQPFDILRLLLPKITSNPQ